MDPILRDAKYRWLRGFEILLILRTYESLGIHVNSSPPENPESGSIYLFNKRTTKYRKDGINWKKKKDGKTVRENHHIVKVDGMEVLNCCYVHSEENPNFHRRSYTLLNPNQNNIVLVHYLDETLAAQTNTNTTLVANSGGPSSQFHSSQTEQFPQSHNLPLTSQSQITGLNLPPIVGNTSRIFPNLPLPQEKSVPSSSQNHQIQPLHPIHKSSSFQFSSSESSTSGLPFSRESSLPSINLRPNNSINTTSNNSATSSPSPVTTVISNTTNSHNTPEPLPPMSVHPRKQFRSNHSPSTSPPHNSQVSIVFKNEPSTDLLLSPRSQPSTSPPPPLPPISSRSHNFFGSGQSLEIFRSNDFLMASREEDHDQDHEHVSNVDDYYDPSLTNFVSSRGHYHDVADDQFHDDEVERDGFLSSDLYDIEGSDSSHWSEQPQNQHHHFHHQNIHHSNSYHNLEDQYSQSHILNHHGPHSHHSSSQAHFKRENNSEEGHFDFSINFSMEGDNESDIWDKSFSSPQPGIEESLLQISELSRTWDYISGGSKLLILGSNFQNPQLIWTCIFGKTTVNSELINPGVLVCDIPPSEHPHGGFVNFSVSVSKPPRVRGSANSNTTNTTYTSDSVMFEYRRHPSAEIENLLYLSMNERELKLRILERLFAIRNCITSKPSKSEIIKFNKQCVDNSFSKLNTHKLNQAIDSSREDEADLTDTNSTPHMNLSRSAQSDNSDDEEDEEDEEEMEEEEEEEGEDAGEEEEATDVGDEDIDENGLNESFQGKREELSPSPSNSSRPTLSTITLGSSTEGRGKKLRRDPDSVIEKENFNEKDLLELTEKQFDQKISRIVCKLYGFIRFETQKKLDTSGSPPSSLSPNQIAPTSLSPVQLDSPTDVLLPSSTASYANASHTSSLSSTPVCLINFGLIHYAAALDCQHLLSVLIGFGNNVNELDLNHRTPLHWAARAGSQRAVWFLIGSGSDTTIQDLQLNTPLNAAIEHRHRNVAALLIMAKANSSIPNAENLSETSLSEIFNVLLTLDSPSYQRSTSASEAHLWHSLESAAIKIQLAYRGHKERQRVTHRENEAAIKIQEAYRRYKSRNQKRLEKAASKIQKAYIVYTKMLQRNKYKKAVFTQNEAAKKIQSAYRVHRRASTTPDSRQGLSPGPSSWGTISSPLSSPSPDSGSSSASTPSLSQLPSPASSIPSRVQKRPYSASSPETQPQPWFRNHDFFNLSTNNSDSQPQFSFQPAPRSSPRASSRPSQQKNRTSSTSTTVTNTQTQTQTQLQTQPQPQTQPQNQHISSSVPV